MERGPDQMREPHRAYRLLKDAKRVLSKEHMAPTFIRQTVPPGGGAKRHFDKRARNFGHVPLAIAQEWRELEAADRSTDV